MPKSNWSTEYKWEMNKVEKAFDTRLKKEGFEILGVKMYVSKMEWKIKKDNIEMEYAIMKEATKPALVWKVFLDYYNTCKEYHKLKSEAEKKGII